jgi:hypothetical protein
MQSSTGTVSRYLIAVNIHSGINICSFSLSVPVIAKALCRIHLPLQFTPAHGPLFVQACALPKKNYSAKCNIILNSSACH